MLPVSFGAMLMESMLAVIALIAVASFTSTGAAAEQGYTTPPQIFAGGVSNFLQAVGLPKDVVFTLINLAVSAFALTSLDSVARVGRLSFQELFLDASIKDEDMGPVRKVLTNKYFATIITLVLAYLLAKAGYASIWPLFGSANQLLSALALVGLRCVPQAHQAQGLYALDSHGGNDCCYLYCTGDDYLAAHFRPGRWHLCMGFRYDYHGERRQRIDRLGRLPAVGICCTDFGFGCSCSNSGREEAVRQRGTRCGSRVTF